MTLERFKKLREEDAVSTTNSTVDRFNKLRVKDAPSKSTVERFNAFSAVALEQRGESRLAELGGVLRRLPSSALDILTTGGVGSGGQAGADVLDLAQGGAEISTAQLIRGPASIPFDATSQDIQEAQRMGFTERLGAQLEAPLLERLFTEGALDPLNLIPFGFLGRSGRAVQTVTKAPVPRPQLALPPGTGRTVEGAITAPGRVAPRVVPSVTVPTTQKMLGPGVASPARGSEVPPGVLRQGVAQTPEGVPSLRSLEASTPQEAAQLRAQVRNNLDIREEASLSVGTVPEPSVQRAAVPSDAPVTQFDDSLTLDPNKDPVIKKALRIVQQGKRISKEERAALVSRQRRQRFARGSRAEEAASFMEKGPAFFRAQAGEFDVVTPDIQLINTLEEDEIIHLMKRIRTPGVLRSGYDVNRADLAFRKLFMNEQQILPTDGELTLLDRAFGGKLARAIYNKKRTMSQLAWEAFLDAWNLPRSFRTSIDLSAMLRQGGLLASNNKVIWGRAAKSQVKAFLSEKHANRAWDEIYLDDDFELLTDNGLFLAQRGGGSRLAQREEAYLSRWAGNIPGIKQSEQAYITMLNKLRFDVGKKLLRELRVQNLPDIEFTKEIQAMTKYINVTTGRGVGFGSTSVNAIFNGIFFSPRWATSRFEVLALPLTSIRKSKVLRKKMAADLVTAFGTSSLLAALAQFSGLGTVELDVRSGNWGSIQIGKSRYDPFFGMRPIMRFIAQLAIGQGKSSLGQVYSLDDEELISKRKRLKEEGRKLSDDEFAREGRFLPARLARLRTFLRSRLAPVPAEAWDQLTGEDWLGDSVKLSDFGRASRKNPLVQQFVPLIAEEIMDSIAAHKDPWMPLRALGSAIGEVVGITVSSYTTPGDVAEERNIPLPIRPGLQGRRIKKQLREAADEADSLFQR